jgi:Na+/H+ antiporter NhaA
MQLQNERQASERQHQPVLRVFLRMLQVGSVLGAIYTIALTAAREPDWQWMLYASWFAIAAVSAEAILHWIKAGVYVLVLATLVVSFVELGAGTATLGGASLALLLLFVLVTYIYPEWDQYDD